MNLTPLAESLVLAAISAVLTSRCGGDVENKAAARKRGAKKASSSSSADDDDEGMTGMIEVATESILADVMDDGVPDDAVSARDRFQPILFSCDVAPHDDGDDDDDDDDDIFTELHDAIATAVMKSEEDEDEDANLAHNECEMCERVTPLTRHHLFPRSQVKHFKKRGFCPPGRSVDEVAAVCRQCHSAIHSFAGERVGVCPFLHAPPPPPPHSKKKGLNPAPLELPLYHSVSVSSPPTSDCVIIHIIHIIRVPCTAYKPHV